MLLHLWNVGALFAVLLLLAAPDTISTARTLLPHVLLSLVALLVTETRRFLVVAVIAFNVVIAGPGLQFYQEFRGRAVYADRELVERFRQDVASHLAFDPMAGSWCNTVAVTLGDYNTQLIAIPPGMGITYLAAGRHLAHPMKSRYLLLPPALLGLVEPRTRIRQIAGNLYENLDARCAETGAAAPAEGESAAVRPD